jgi:hypothetical protein
MATSTSTSQVVHYGWSGTAEVSLTGDGQVAIGYLARIVAPDLTVTRDNGAVEVCKRRSSGMGEALMRAAALDALLARQESESEAILRAWDAAHPAPTGKAATPEAVDAYAAAAADAAADAEATAEQAILSSGTLTVTAKGRAARVKPVSLRALAQARGR